LPFEQLGAPGPSRVALCPKSSRGLISDKLKNLLYSRDPMWSVLVFRMSIANAVSAE